MSSDVDPAPVAGCGTCVYSRVMFTEGDDVRPLLECHRYPPQMIVLAEADQELHHAFPSMGDTDWCGEYRHG